MDQSLSFNDDAISMIYAEEVATSFQNQMQEVERLAAELHNLLASYGVPLDQENPESNLGRWAESYRRGLMAADKIRRNGGAWLQNVGRSLHQHSRAEIPDPNSAACGKAVFRAMDFEDDARKGDSIVAQRRNLFGQQASGAARAR